MFSFFNLGYFSVYFGFFGFRGKLTVWVFLQKDFIQSNRASIGFFLLEPLRQVKQNILRHIFKDNGFFQ